MTPSPSAGEPASCPFCGGRGEVRNWIDERAKIIECQECEATTGDHPTAVEAIAAWNRRATPPATASEQDVEAVEAARRIVNGHVRSLSGYFEEGDALRVARAYLALAAPSATGEKE